MQAKNDASYSDEPPRGYFYTEGYQLTLFDLLFNFNNHLILQTDKEFFYSEINLIHKNQVDTSNRKEEYLILRKKKKINLI